MPFRQIIIFQIKCIVLLFVCAAVFCTGIKSARANSIALRLMGAFAVGFTEELGKFAANTIINSAEDKYNTYIMGDGWQAISKSQVCISRVKNVCEPCYYNSKNSTCILINEPPLEYYCERNVCTLAPLQGEWGEHTLKACNNTLCEIQFSLIYPYVNTRIGTAYSLKGWYTLAENSCVDITVESKIVYYYAKHLFVINLYTNLYTKNGKEKIQHSAFQIICSSY